MTSKIEEIILDWDNCAIEVKAAIGKRDYGGFRKMFIKGNRCFKKIKELIEKGDIQNLKDLKEIKEKVSKTVSDWTIVSKEIPEWISEMKSELDKKKAIAKKDKKLSGAYKKFTKNTGIKLKVKAR